MIVTTIRGKETDRKNCIKINDEYYEKDIDVVQINNRWYRISNPKIYYNSVENQYKKITEFTVNGICDIIDGDYVFGRFEKTFENHYPIKTKRGTYFCANKLIFDKINKIWNNGAGYYMDMDYTVYSGYNKAYDIKSNNYIYDFERLYNSEKLLPRFQEIDNKKYAKNLLGEINKSNKKFDLINKYSFGLEIETAGGVLPQHTCVHLGLIPLRDGSIRGHEYTTIPMIGEDGVNLLMNQLSEIKDKCIIDKECSLHVHFGNFPLNENKILRLYNLLYNLQDEIGDLFHSRIYNTGAYKSSGKDYCKRFPGKAGSIDSLYSHLCEGDASWNGDFYRPHPHDPERDRKWENHRRYYFCNLINMLFGDSAKTVEFRLHTPTFNYTKIINWLFICTSILNYAESSEKITDVSLADVVSFSNDKETAAIINEYITRRTELNIYNYRKHNDTYGVIDLITDCDVEFKTPYH